MGDDLNAYKADSFQLLDESDAGLILLLGVVAGVIYDTLALIGWL